MAKRRTRKQKEKARHNLAIHWEPGSNSEPDKTSNNASVKGQLKSRNTKKRSKNTSHSIPSYTGKIDNLASIRKDIVKSLGLSGFVLALEIVIYLFRA